MGDVSGRVRRGPQLLTYPDSLGGDLRALDALLRGPLEGLFAGVHVLPPFPSSGDRGFAPLTYRDVDPAFGTWADIRRLAERHDVVLDLMINHLSRQSPEFQDFARRGRRSPHADLFITLDKVWPDGDPPASDIARIFLRKPSHPFSTFRIADTGEEERVWTSFGSGGWSEQIDLDVAADATRRLVTDWLRSFASHGVRIVRLDAAGYVVKKAGTSCFMVEPDIYEFLDWVSGVADSLGLAVLPEIHDEPETRRKLAGHGYWTYDFVLPALVLHSLHTGSVARLADHLSASPPRQFTMLDCHDGIPIQPDLRGILDGGDLRQLTALVERQGGNVNRILSSAHATELDVHQLNCTYYAALAGDDDRYVAARAIQLFAPGIPQVYYVGLLAGGNDHDAVLRAGDGRAINRHDYRSPEIEDALERPVVRRILRLVRLRNGHPAFAGALDVASDRPSALRLTWRSDADRCELEVDVESGGAVITSSRGGGTSERFMA